MSTLEGKSIATTYKDLLQVSNNNVGIDGTIRPIEDGEGTQSALALSTDTIEIRGSIIPSTNSTFDIGSAERKIRHLYLSSNSLYVGDLQFSEQDVQEVKNVRGGAYATSTQGALAETAIQPGEFAFSLLSEIPTTLAGYGITDAATAAQGAAADTALAKASTALQPGGVSFTDDLTDRPTTIAGYGITDAFNGSFSNLTDRPTSLAGYGITDAATSAQGDKADSALQPGAIIPFSNVSNKPTSLAGYGITDAATSAQGDKADSALQPGATIPWSTVSNTPTTLAGYEITDAATSTQGDKADSALQPNTSIHVNTMHVSGGKIYGPTTMYIDPEAIGDNTGKLVILGDLQVDGVTTTVNSTTVSVSGKTIELAGGAGDPAQVDGAGVTVAASDASMLYKVTTDSWDFNKKLATAGTNGSSIKITRSNWKGVAEAGDISFHSGGTSGELANPVAKIVGLDTFAGGNTPYNGELAFYTLNGNSSNERMRIDTTGNVGIGTTDPSTSLEVQGPNQGVALFKSQSTAENATTTIAIESPNATSNGRTRIGADVDDLFFSTSEGASNPNSSVERMRIDTNGRVGIGTTNPSAPLHTSNTNGDAYNIFEGSLGRWVFGQVGTSYCQVGGLYNIHSGIAVDSDGNVGIGTTNPNNTALHVNSSLDGPIFWSGGTGNTNHALLVGDSEQNQLLRVNNNGNVGIGTTSPGALLHVAPKNNVDANGDPTNESHFKVYDNDTSGLAQGRNGGVVFIDANYYLGTSTIFAVNGRGDNKFTIQGSGNVGIGTTDPGEILHVEKTVGTTLVKTEVGGNSVVGFDIKKTGATNQEWRIVDGQTINGKLEIYDVTDSRSVMAFDGDGNVGIGTTSPITTLDVRGADASIGISQKNTAGDGQTTGLYMSVGGNDGSHNSSVHIKCHQPNALSHNTQLQITARTTLGDWNPIIYADADTNAIAIGGSSLTQNLTDEKLIVHGHARTHRIFPATDNTFDVGHLSYRWDDIIATNGTIATSDANEKNTIVDSDLGLDFIKKLSPKSYKFNSGSRTHYGLIAQDVEQVLSDVSKDTTEFAGFIKQDVSVDQDGSDFRYGLRYNEFIAPMLKAIQEQQTMIDELKAQNESLISRIETLENK